MKIDLKTNFLLIILIVIVTILFGYLFWMNFSPLGTQTITYKFDKSKFISQLRPSTRTSDIICKDFCFQEAFNNPVYFDLFHPRRFKNARITMEFYDPAEKEVKIGVKIGNEFEYYEQTIESIKLEDGWLVGTVQLDLEKAKIKNNLTTFIISAEHIKNNEEKILIRQITLELEREAYFNKIINKINELTK